jgi:competence ComEA-like helix-hairpin-helix protein
MLPRGEQRALIVLSFVLVFSLGIRIVVQLIPGREPAGMEEFEKEYHTLMNALARADSMKNPSFLARSDSMVNATNPSGNSSPVHQSPVTSRSESSPVTSQSQININRADSAQLLPLPGIGPVFAGRIIKYRDLLGGFVRMEQLGEVYGLKQETLEMIKDHIHIDTSSIRKLHMDSASFRELLRHPYLDLEEVKALVAYRNFKQDISTLEELRANAILEDSTIQRVAPYFDTGN